ncbi:putative outer membrane protein [Wolbachia endosymbiont of Armadillidium vulgare str. wVulC]|uniref:P44/Msp2 family outer membrane protein n=1 Tax=Wolbachia endosymbiont of Armadillidium vulgare TaxID=77039 RepID=UPI00064A2E15|nr:P44/Msp2 family outer membrane protein [Wolbachia endosymbiont of Armadillidium vulgare]KLT22629.1 putative outer membrane protein [Wolbachia endosymbiont of Armadillidium vulgare str. wVulC]
MKKLLTLLACCSLSVPSFGVDWIKDRTYTSSSYGMLGVNYDLGYHCTDSVKISFGRAVKLVINEGILDAGIMAKFHYHYKFESTDITPYITFGVGGVAKIPLSEEQGTDVEGFFSYQIGSGINLPLSERTNVFAGYKLQKFHELSHGVELGMSFNL